jgi:hypothetical protein
MDSAYVPSKRLVEVLLLGLATGIMQSLFVEAFVATVNIAFEPTSGRIRHGAK